MNVDRSTSKAEILKALGRIPAVALLGPRQVGKSTLARKIASAWGGGATVLDLEVASDQRKIGPDSGWLAMRAGKLTVIDEVHRAPGLFAELRAEIDARRRAGEAAGQFLLLGSASLNLIDQASESLAGRVTYQELAPIQPDEAQAAGLLHDQLWLRGGFPLSLLAPDEEASYLWRRDFLRTYMERDVPLFAPRMPAATVWRLWRMLANGQGTLLNTARLATGLGVNANTVSRYIDLLDDLMLVRRLAPWSSNLGKRLVRSPKVYVRDSGLTHALLEIGGMDQLLGHPVCGLSWEGFVIEALIQAAGPFAQPYFYRTAGGAEIDLVLARSGSPVLAVEVKRGLGARLEAGFTLGSDDLGIVDRMVVHGGADSWMLRNGTMARALDAAVVHVRSVFANPFPVE
jgi:uncharacterized protein